MSASASSGTIKLSSFSHPREPAVIFNAKAFIGRCMSVNEFQKLNRVGEGTYGIVYRSKNKDGKIVALKRIRMENVESEGFPVSALREISILMNLNHPNIVKVDGVAVGDALDSIFMVMEYCEQDMAYLMDHVMSRNTKHAYKQDQVKCLLYQLLDGVNYLHGRKIIHRDLKLSNILLTSKGVLKIADFGLARIIEDKMTPRVVTLWYRAPEVLFGDENYTKAVDLWSVGCIFGEWMRLLGSPNPEIWPDMVDLPLYDTIKLPDIGFDSLKSIFVKSSVGAQSLLAKFLVYRPALRISASSALNDKYFSEYPQKCQPKELPTFPELRNENKSEEIKPDNESEVVNPMKKKIKY